MVQPPAASSSSGTAHERRAEAAAQDFEALFLRILLSQMRSTVVKSGLFGKGLATDIYEEMFFSQIADTLAASKPGTGVKDIVFQAIMNAQPVKNAPDSADI